MKNILYIISTLDKTGPNNILLGIIKNLDAKKYNVTILTLSPTKDNSLEIEILKLGHEVIKIDKSRFLGVIVYKKIINQIINERKINIVHSSGIRGDYYNSLITKKITKITTIHSYLVDDYKFSYGDKLGKIISMFHILFLKKIDYRISCSETVKDKLSKYLKTYFIRNGINLSKYYYSSKEFNKSELKFVFSGNISRLKNIQLILKTFDELKEYKNIKLYILGDGILLNKFKEEYQNNSNIIFEGRVKNIENYLKNMNYYISASLTEGMPNSVMEAMGMGLPCILSDINAHKELGGEYLEYFSPQNYSELKKIIIKKLKVSKSEYIKESLKMRKRIEEEFDEVIMSKLYQKYYE